MSESGAQKPWDGKRETCDEDEGAGHGWKCAMVVELGELFRSLVVKAVGLEGF